MPALRIRTRDAGWDGRLAAEVLARPRARPPRVVAVEGRSGSGKSTVAEHLRAALVRRGEPVAVVTMEDLYPGWEGLARAPEFLRTWVLEPLARGGRVAWRRYDWERGAFAPDWTEPSPDLAKAGGTLVVEGCGAGAAAVRDHLDLLVWVAVTDDERLRRLDRREDADLYAPYRALWARQEEAFYAEHRPGEHADVVVDNSGGGTAAG